MKRNIFKTVSVICAVAMMMGVFAVLANAAPSSINGNNVGTYTEIDLSKVSTWAQKKDSDFSGIRNGQIEIECGTTYNEGTATLPSVTDISGYDGVLLHVDLSNPTWGVNAEPEYTKCYLGVRIYTEGITGYVWTRDTNKLADGSYLNYDIDAYYSADGSDWSKTSLVYDGTHTLDKSTGDGERFIFPGGFKGWIYIPFSSYNTTKIDNDTNKYPVKGFYNTNVTKIMVLTGGYTAADDNKIVVDSIGFAKFGASSGDPSEGGDTPVTPTPEPTTYKDGRPRKILKSYYSRTKLLTFDSTIASDSISISGDRCTFSQKKVGISGNAGVLTTGSNTCEATFTLGESVDLTQYSGVLFWADVSGVKVNKNNATGVAVRFSPEGGGTIWTRNRIDQTEPAVDGFHVHAYYFDGENWHECDESIMNGERVQLPEGFKGWVYIPFKSYLSTKEGVAGLSDSAKAVNKLMLLSGPYKTADGGDVVFDEIQLVKLGGSASTGDSLAVGVIVSTVALVCAGVTISVTGKRKKED
ncbi:MAG: hypothetical protein J5830_01805 [Clostridia bacterium]|nr:hypothetical protein [Clostridia bacterium]